MKTKDLVKLVESGVKPIIRVIESESLEGPDDGMLGRIISVGKPDNWGKDGVAIPFIVDFTEFEKINKSLAQKNWFDIYGNPNLSWFETPYYNKEANNFSIFETYKKRKKYGNLHIIELVEGGNFPWVKEYLESNIQTNYVKFLEYKLNKKKKYLKKIAKNLKKLKCKPRYKHGHSS